MSSNPLRVPYVAARFKSSYRVMTQPGFHIFLPFAEIFANIQQGTTQRTYDESFGNPADNRMAIAISHLTNAAHTVSAAGFAKLGLRGSPSLVLERHTGTVMLRPEPLFRSSRLVGSGDEAYHHRCYTGENLHPTDPTNWPLGSGSIGGSVDTQSWYAVNAANRTNGKFREADMGGPSPQAPTTDDTLFGDDNDPLQTVKLLEYHHAEGDTNLHTLVSAFEHTQNLSFFIGAQVAPPTTAAVKAGTPPQLTVRWGQYYAIRFRHDRVQFTDNADAAESARIWQDVSGLTTGRFNFWNATANYWFVHVLPISNSIVLLNGFDTFGDGVLPTAARGWQSRHLTRTADGVLVPGYDPSSSFGDGPFLYADFQYGSGTFGLFPCRCVKEGTLAPLQDLDVGYSITAPTIDTYHLIDQTTGGSDIGEIVTEAHASGTEYGWSIELHADDVRRDRSPELYSAAIDVPPQFTTADFSHIFPTFPGGEIPPERILSANLQLGILDQSATIVVDNRDGAFGDPDHSTIPPGQDVCGIYPFEIDTGWYRKNDSGTSPAVVARRLTGFLTKVDTSKRSDVSTATLTITGRKLQLEDSKAVNLPIFDGYDHIEAIELLLQRAGIEPSSASNFTSTLTAGETQIPLAAPEFYDYELPLPLPGDQPRFNFNLGTPIWNCIGEIAKIVGGWYFFDAYGVLHYVPPFRRAAKTFREIPSTASAAGIIQDYDEIVALSSSQETSEIFNAIMVIGMDARSPVPLPKVAIKKADLTDTQDFAYIPWYRWAVHGDAKLNNDQVNDWLANRMYNNAKRPRITARGRIWGNPNVAPLDNVKIQLQGATSTHPHPWSWLNGLKTDNIILPAQTYGFRVLGVTDTIDCQAGRYTTELELEYDDPNTAWGSWWNPGVL